MDWATFETEIKDLATKIDYQPNVIIGISRGGIIPARLLSRDLNVKEMYCIGVSKADGERRIVTDLLNDLVDRNILLVEDMLETGRSLVVAKQYLESKGAEVKTACLYTMPISEINPDFYIRQIQKVERFPWD
jgi:uncharacterized protein